MGKRYIKSLTESLKNEKFDKAYSSTSNRTKKTIMPLAELNNLDIIQDENLCEMYFGIYDGWTWDEVDKIDYKISQLHEKTNEIMSIPNQETTQQVQERMYKYIEKISKENLGKKILICSHGVAIEAFLRKITGVPFIEQVQEYSQKNTSLNIVEYSKNDGFKVLVLNNIEHLRNEKFNEEK